MLGPAVIGMDPADQRAIDNKMIDIDGTPNKNKMGANGKCKLFRCLGLRLFSPRISHISHTYQYTNSHPWSLTSSIKGRCRSQQLAPLRTLCQTGW